LPPDLKSITADVVAPSVIATYPHDASAFTQGLLFHNGKLYESTGRYEHSTLREVDIKSGIISRSIQLEDSFFAEGLARINDQLYQLTWQKGQAFVYDLKTFTKVKLSSMKPMVGGCALMVQISICRMVVQRFISATRILLRLKTRYR